MIMKNGFIEQTANDYDMPYSEVEWIFNNKINLER